MKIAVISDIHGNLEALKATLKDIEKRKVDKIICLGDIIAKGVHPKECISLIRTNCEIVLQGNCDVHFSTEHKNIDEMNEQEKKRIKWNQSLIDKEDREYLSDISFQFIKVPYDIDRELEDENLNIEKENYRFELKQGMYRDMTRINENFKKLGIDVDKI